MEIIPSKKERRFFRTACRQSRSSNMKYKHGSVITVGGRVVFSGYNHYYYSSCNVLDNVKLAILKSNVASSEHLGNVVHSIHAEVDVLNKLVTSPKNNINPQRKKINIYVVRMSPTGNLVNSKPCKTCTIVMKKYRINKVYYSSENGKFCVEKVR